ncbi:hypothetical protein [Clostridium sp.]|uniref:hypothetical protein n=1 Tax=Clostridium sp. TaxID=1506 RepID=UPI003216DE1A
MRKKIISLSMAVALCLTVGLYSMNKVFQGENSFNSNNNMKLLSMGCDLDSTPNTTDPGITEPK